MSGLPRSLAEEIREELPSIEADEETHTTLQKWLAADDAFNHWFLDTTKRSLDDDDLLSLLDGYRESQEAAESAWRSFQEGHAEPGSLRTGLSESLAKMNALMNR